MTLNFEVKSLGQITGGFVLIFAISITITSGWIVIDKTNLGTRPHGSQIEYDLDLKMALTFKVK